MDERITALCQAIRRLHDLARAVHTDKQLRRFNDATLLLEQDGPALVASIRENCTAIRQALSGTVTAAGRERIVGATQAVEFSAGVLVTPAELKDIIDSSDENGRPLPSIAVVKDDYDRRARLNAAAERALAAIESLRPWMDGLPPPVQTEYGTTRAIAAMVPMGHEACRKRLERFATNDGIDCRIPVEDRRVREPSWLYHVPTVLPLLRGVR